MTPGRPSQTAELVGLIRALEYSYHAERSLIKDNFAHRFLSVPVRAIYELMSWPGLEAPFNTASLGLYEWIVLRHAFLDTFVRQHGLELPVVLLGAGYDCRGLRLGPYLRKGLYEVDFPATQARKKRKLQSIFRGDSGAELGEAPIRYLPADFTTEPLGEILAKLDLVGQTALVLWEGVTMYVDEPVVRATITEVGKYFGGGTILLADYWTKPDNTLWQRAIQGVASFALGTVGEPLRFYKEPGKMKRLAHECGGSVFTSYDAQAMAARVGRPIKNPLAFNEVAYIKY